MSSSKNIEIFQLQTMDYMEAWERQKELAAKCIKSSGSENFFIPVEHPPVITLGRTSGKAEVLTSKQSLTKLGIQIVETNRGGKATFHGPGQLVVYPVIDLRRRGRDLHRYLRELEGWLIGLLASYGIQANAEPPHTGVWIGGAKIASIGIAVRKWVAYHGIALNVNTDLEFFNHIIPCGIKGARMTSMSALLDKKLPMDRLSSNAAALFKEYFGFT